MSFKEVKELRKEGKLNEALAMATADLDAQPENVWNKRSMGWVIYEYAKEASAKFDFEGLKENIEKLIALNLPPEEKMIFSNFVWPIAKYVFHEGAKGDSDNQEVTELFRLCQLIPFEKPSENYSVLLKSFLKFSHNWYSFKKFVDWWGLENLRSEDFLKDKLPNGKEVMALAEQVYIAYARKLLQGEINANNPFDPKRIVDRVQVISFLEKLDVIIETYPEFQYPQYFKAKLLLAIGTDDDVLVSFLPFAKKKKNEFWVWELMAEIFNSDLKKVIACYSKALSCKVSPDFLVKTRQHFASILISQKYFDNAKTEIELLSKARMAHGWKIPFEVVNWQNEVWYTTAKNLGNNEIFYKKYLAEAEELLFHDVKPLIGIVEFVNRDKKILNFIVSKEIHGFFKYEWLIENPNIGEVLSMKIEKRKGDGGEYYFVLTAEKSDEIPSSEIMKSFEGPFSKRDNADFAFVRDIFIEPRLVAEKPFVVGSDVKGTAILTFNRKKGVWGWKAIEINSILRD